MKFRGGEFSTGTTGNFQPELTRSLRERPVCHRGRMIAVKALPSSSLFTDHPKRFMSDRKRIQIALATSSTLSSQRSAVAPAVQITPQTVKHPTFCPASSRRRHLTAIQHARLRAYLPAYAHHFESHLSSKTHSAHTLQRFSPKHF